MSFFYSLFSSIQTARPDYLTNIWDDWVADENIIVDVNNLDIDSWTGRINSVQFSPVLTTEDIPSNKAITLNIDGQGFALTNNNPGISATDVTFAFLLQKSAAHGETNGIWLFDCVSSPRLILKFEISSANPNLGLQYNGIDYDFGVSFPFDSNYHALVFRFSGTTATVWIDGVLSGTVNGLTGGQFQMNSSATRRFLRGGSTITRTYKGAIKKIRVYLEGVSQSNIELISNPANAFFNNLPRNNVRFFNGAGQSLESGSGAWGTLPSNLQGVISRCYIWDNNARKYNPLSSVVYTLSSPVLSFCYDMAQKYPSDDIMFVMGAVGGTNMDSWLPSSGARYIANKGWCDNAITQVINVQQRTVLQRGGLWMHGQTDAENAGLAAAYGPKEATFLTQWKTDFGHNTIVSGYVRTDLPPPSTLSNINAINAGKTANAVSDPSIQLFTDTYEISGDNLHHTTQGNIDLGTKQATYY
jgi:hypothetical protein